MLDFETKEVPINYDDIASDSSEIPLLPGMNEGGICHCTLPPGKTSIAVKHRTIEEIWYCLEGEGEVWRKMGDQEEVTKFTPGICMTIPTGTHFQFKNFGTKPLCLIIATMPPWPGPSEAVTIDGKWEVHL